MQKYKGYYSVAGDGVSVAGENILKGKGTVENVSVFVDGNCGISFNYGEYIKVMGGGGYNFNRSCQSVIIDTDGVYYSFGGTRNGELEVV